MAGVGSGVAAASVGAAVAGATVDALSFGAIVSVVRQEQKKTDKKISVMKIEMRRISMIVSPYLIYGCDACSTLRLFCERAFERSAIVNMEGTGS